MKRAVVLLAALLVVTGTAGCRELGGNNVNSAEEDSGYPVMEETSVPEDGENSELFRVVSDLPQSSQNSQTSESSDKTSKKKPESSTGEDGELFRVVSDLSKAESSGTRNSSKSQTSKVENSSKPQTSKAESSSRPQTSKAETSSKPAESSGQEHSPEPSREPSRPSTPSRVETSSRAPEPVSQASVPVTPESREESSEPSQAPAQDDAGLLNSLHNAGYELGDLDAIGCRQLITVNSSGSTAVISFYENRSGIWEKESSLTTNGFVGSQGVSSYSYEGSHQTPFGLYGVGDAFYIDDQPQTGLNSFHVTEETYWVDDPDSAYYNRLVEGTDGKDWNSAEHMIDYASYYKYGFVIEFNTYDPVPGKGSAIFFHINDHATAGCVAVSESMVLAYLRRLDKGQNPQILIQ